MMEVIKSPKKIYFFTCKNSSINYIEEIIKADTEKKAWELFQDSLLAFDQNLDAEFPSALDDYSCREITVEEAEYQNVLFGIEEYTLSKGIEHAVQKMVASFGEEKVRRAMEYGNEYDLLKLI